jgi:hypothetical protein
MFEKIKERLFPFLIALSALSVSASAAFYSITGLSKLFAGAALEVIIMASTLEIAKLIIASLLYQYRKSLPKILKGYLTLACVILMLITSMGIYGFLSASYQEVANKTQLSENEIELIEKQKDNIEDQLNFLSKEKQSITLSILELQKGLSNNIIQYKDNKTGEIITTTSSSTRKALEKQLDQSINRQNILNSKIDSLNIIFFEKENKIFEIEQTNESASELGPLKYLSILTGTPMNKIINWLLLTIIFVFDPLAISLVIAANFAFEQIKNKYKQNIYGETVLQVETPQPLIVSEQSSSMEAFPPEKKSPPLIPSGLSAWRRNKIIRENQKKDDDLTKTY